MIFKNYVLLAASALVASSLHATIVITSFTPSLTSPQPLGTTVTWNTTSTDTQPGLLTFRYSVAYESGPNRVVSDFYPGTLASGVWTAPAFPWATIQGEGVYHVQVVAKNFRSGEITSASVAFTLNPISTGKQFVVSPTANPLIALASAPPCPAGDSFRITIQSVGAQVVEESNWVACDPPLTMNAYAVEMLPSTEYAINYQVMTGSSSGKIITGRQPANFTTGALPANIPFPQFSNIVPTGSQINQTDQTVLHGLLPIGNSFLVVATNLTGQIVWYYNIYDPVSTDIFTRPLAGGTMLTLQDGNSWNPNLLENDQLVVEIDLAGNLVRETNIGVLQQQLVAKGATDFRPCGAVQLPAAIGAACMGSMHHDAIRMPNGYTAVNVSIEKIFPPYTQGDTTGLNVDIIGDGVLVLDQNFQLVWSFDTFQHDGGLPQLDINRPPVLGEVSTENCCLSPTIYLANTSGVEQYAHDWLHQNSLYFDPVQGDFVVSTRHQDWLYKIDYNNGAGTGNIVWVMGLDGSFTFNNINNDPYPWFSHQHDAEIQNTATGELTLFDNGNTRVSPPPLGLGSGNSRGMSLTVDETNMTVTPLLSQDLGFYADAVGSAQLLSNSNYFFQPGIVDPNYWSYSMELLPTAGTVNGTAVFNQQATYYSYRSWAMPNLYQGPVN